MKIVALLSGGKDSCYNLLHCAANGHTLVAAASLGPEAGKEELDSYMYQTVGQDAIDVIARALDVPLYRRVISGSALEQGNEYGSRDGNDPGTSSSAGDETEDLYELLRTVLKAHPDVQGVSVGAILSNYQRVRVEHVCRRLGLTSLAYLWQRDQTELLGEMVDNGLEAVLIKVAGAGLTAKHLGKTLGQMQPTLHKLRDLYQTHVCGEGGEYETLTLDSPMFKRRVNLLEVETVTVDANEIAPVAYLRVKKAELGETKEPLPSFNPPRPPLLDDQWQELADNMTRLFPLPTEPAVGAKQKEHDFQTQKLPEVVSSELATPGGKWHAISNVVAAESSSMTFDEECRICWDRLRAELQSKDLTLMHLSHINVYLSSMTHFPVLNNIMYSIFGTSPPTRACVAVDLPAPSRVRLDVSAYSDARTTKRHALHVQGLSYWAPANIGPYSQSITIDRQRMFVSGQIGLIPASMTMPSPQNVALELALSLQHASRIVSLTLDTLGHTKASPTNDAAIFWMVDEGDVKMVSAAWEEVRKEEPSRCSDAILVGVAELPRGARIESQLLYRTGIPVRDDEDADQGEAEAEDIDTSRVGWTSISHPLSIPSISPSSDPPRIELQYQRSSSTSSHRRTPAQPLPAWIGLRGVSSSDVGALAADFADVARLATGFSCQPLHIRAFYTCHASAGLVETLGSAIFGPTSAFFLETQNPARVPPITPIPARFLATTNDETWDVVFCLF